MIAVAATLGLLLLCLWLARGPLGVWAATDYLRRQGVPSRITVERLTFQGFKGGLALGPPGDPDLTAEDIEVDYALFPGRRLGLRVTAVRLSDVTAKLVYDGKTLRYGSLQKLIDDALAAPPSLAPGPKISFDRATVRLATPAGALALTGNGQIDDARVQRLNLAVAAPALKTAALSVQGLAGTVTVAGGARLAAQVAVSARTLQVGDAAANALTLVAHADLPYGRDARLSGPATLDAVARAAQFTGAGWKGEAAQARLDLSGALAGTLTAPRYAGVASLALETRTAGGPGIALGGAGLNIASESLDAAFDKGAFSGGGPVAGRAFAASGRADLGRRSLRLANLNLRSSGRADVAASGFTADLAGGLDAEGGFSRDDARALADMVIPPDLDPAINAALRRGLASLRLSAPRYQVAVGKGGASVRLPQAARIAFDGGAVTLASATAAIGGQTTTGAVQATLSGAGLPKLDLAVNRYSLSPTGVDASARLALDGAAFGLRGARLAPDLRLTQSAGGLRIALDRCSAFSIQAYGETSAPMLQDAKGQLCPGPEPLVAVRGPGWRAAARLTGLSARLPTAEAVLADAAVSLDIRGGGQSAPHGDIVVDHARLTDAAAMPRFGALKASGRLALNGDVISGAVSAGPAAPIATVQIVHDIAKGAGRAVLAPTTLTFAPDGLQPAQLSPAAAVLTKVSGAALASATVTWTKDALDGAAQISTAGLDLTTPVGRVTGLKGAVALTSMVPALVTAPDQHLTAARLDAVTPLTDLDLRFALNGDTLRLGAASATLAKGKASLDPMTVSLAPNAPLSGTLRLADVDLGEILAGFNLSESVTLQARIEATLPFSLSSEGLRFKEGRVAATGPGRLSIKRAALTGVAASATQAAPGAPPPAATQTNAVQDFAYQALENLAFDELDAKVDSRPQGRLGVIFHLKGRNDPPVAQKARIKLQDLLRGTAFDKSIPLPSGTPVDLTLDTSLNFDDLMAAYARIGRSDAVQPEN